MKPFFGNSQNQISFKIVRSFLEYSRDTNQLSKAEDRLKLIDFDIEDAKNLLIIAKEFNLLKFITHISCDYLNDFIPPCELHFQNGTLSTFVNSIFSSYCTLENKRTVLVWLMQPSKDYLSHIDFVKLKEMFLCFPIQLATSNDVIKHYHFIDRILQTFDKIDYQKIKVQISTLVDNICALANTITFQEISLSGASLAHLLEHIFTSNDNFANRETLLSHLLVGYPSLASQIEEFCETSGFVSVLLKSSHPNFSKILGGMLNHPDKDQLFPFVLKHIQEKEMIEALKVHFREILRLNPLRTFDIVYNNARSIQPEFLRQLNSFENFLWLSAKLDFGSEMKGEDVRIELEGEEIVQYFTLVCQHTESKAVLFLTESIQKGSNLDLNALLKIAEKFKRVDCQVRIQRELRHFEQALQLVHSEIENSLLHFIESDSTVQINSIEELQKTEEIKQSFDACQIALDLLYSFDSEIDENWKHVFDAFRFPLYRCLQKNDNIKNVINTIFGFFVVESLSALQSETVFLIIATSFAMLTTEQYHSVVSSVFARLDYDLILTKGLGDLKVGDTLRLIDSVFEKKTKGYVSKKRPVCSACGDAVSGDELPFRLFPCGHCFHSTDKCGKKDLCTICANSNKAGDVEKYDGLDDFSVGERKKVQETIRQFDYCLKQNYGDDASTTKGNLSIFMTPTKSPGTSYIQTRELSIISLPMKNVNL